MSERTIRILGGSAVATSGENSGRNLVGMIGVGAISAKAGAFRQIFARPMAHLRRDLGELQDIPRTRAADEDVNAVLEGDILPRLLMAHCASGAATSAEPNLALSPDIVGRFAELPLTLEAPDLLDEVDRMLGAGLGVETLYVEVLAPAARHLGEMWERDECDFIDVTMGLWRLQEVMRDVAARAPAGVSPLAERRSALFAPMPGDNHSFGAQMIDEVFAHAGWSSAVLASARRRELLDHLARSAVDLVGLTVSRDCPISALASLITAIRSVSLNPHVRIIIGGHVINQDPGIVAKVGADGTGVDAKAALELAERLILAAPLRAPTLT
ncbi:MAG: cobalamin B12-binding domain-containing protein [Erythrobacter sp.]|jgi:methanogenic corrinoid protein MtbC1|nr:cobalamin B12-binding domain-containing protein [Erythrobacter sp.]